jgi:hypothetical protein
MVAVVAVVGVVAVVVVVVVVVVTAAVVAAVGAVMGEMEVPAPALEVGLDETSDSRSASSGSDDCSSSSP